MKTINIKLIAICLVIVGLATIAQAQINYRTSIIGGNSNFAFNFGLTALSNKYCPGADNSLTDAEIAAALQMHNETRHAVGLEPLKWNCALADFAQKWANKDTGSHSTEQERQNIIPGSGAGENLAQGYDSEKHITVQTLIQGWIDEKQFLQSDRKTCTPNPKNTPCGHYTQMVWRTSTELGCGITRKSESFTVDPDSKGKASYLVCIYNPGGNLDGVAAY